MSFLYLTQNVVVHNRNIQFCSDYRCFPAIFRKNLLKEKVSRLKGAVKSYQTAVLVLSWWKRWHPFLSTFRIIFLYLEIKNNVLMILLAQIGIFSKHPFFFYEMYKVYINLWHILYIFTFRSPCVNVFESWY